MSSHVSTTTRHSRNAGVNHGRPGYLSRTWLDAASIELRSLLICPGCTAYMQVTSGSRAPVPRSSTLSQASRSSRYRNWRSKPPTSTRMSRRTIVALAVKEFSGNTNRAGERTTSGEPVGAPWRRGRSSPTVMLEPATMTWPSRRDHSVSRWCGSHWSSSSSRATHSAPSAARRPSSRAAAKPSFWGFSMTRTPRARASSAVPSLEPSSTTITSRGRTPRWPNTEPRARSRRSLRR